MAACDFVVKFDAATDKPQDLTRRILYSIVIRRLKGKKPVVMFVAGKSGEAKSWSSIKLMDELLDIQEVDLNKYMKEVNVYVPLEYPEKLNELLFNKELKKVNVMCVHEAREVINAKLWHSFLTQAISHVNAMSRSVKRMCFIIVSQNIRDITSDVRYTLDYYIKCSRPIGKPARLYISVMYIDDRDLDKPKLKKRKLSGYVINAKGKRKRYIPKYLELQRPRKELTELFEKEDLGAKSEIIKRKMEKLIKAMKLDMDVESKKIQTMIEYYSKSPESLSLIGKRRGNNWHVKKEVKDMHELTDNELKTFQKGLNEKLKSQGVIV